MQPIEGITPESLWIAIGVVLGMCSIYLIFCKVRTEYRKEQDRKAQRNRPGQELANEISKQVIEKLEPRFAEIERKLSNDKAQIEIHSKQIVELSKQSENTQSGVKALCHGMFALLNNAKGTGNPQEIDEAQKVFTNYLAEK